MDKLLVAVDSFNVLVQGSERSKESSKAARQYLTTLQQIPSVAWHSIFHDPRLILKDLNPEVNSIAYAFILNLLLDAKENGSIRDVNIVRDELVSFLLSFNLQQIRFVIAEFRALLEHVASGSLYPPSVAVELLVKVIRRIDHSSVTFTSVHLVLARLAYATNTIEPALDILNSELLFFARTPRTKNAKKQHEIEEEHDEDVPLTTLFMDEATSASVLEYQFLRSLCYISRRDWARAQAALKQIITHPTKDKTVSKIMVDAHKKWILVGLLHTGKAPATPSGVGGSAKSTFHTMSAHYIDIAAVFSADKAGELHASAANFHRELEEDSNVSLMMEVVRSFPKWQIANLRRIYQQVSISQIRRTTLSTALATHVPDDEEVVALVREMIASGMLKGELLVGPTGEESYVKFHDECEVMTEAEFAQAIAQSQRNVEALSKQYRATNLRLSTNQDYIKYVVRQQKMLEREGGGDPGVGFDASIEDEDLMTGVMSHI